MYLPHGRVQKENKLSIYYGRMRFGDSSKAHGIKGYSLHPTEQFLKTLDRTHLQGRKSDKASKYDGYHLLFTFLFISGPLLEIKAVLLYPSLLVILTLATMIY